MSGTVAEFMQKTVKKYACGRKAQEAKKTLVKAFTASEKGKKGEETALFKKILDTVMKTEKGRETLTTLSGFGYSFAFESGNFSGFCDADKKKIVINPHISFPSMLQTAVHEGRHAIQYSLERPDVPAAALVQTASYLRFSRAIEADASAHEAAFAYECKDVIPDVYQDAEKHNFPMFRAYVGEMEKSGDEKKAMQASFAAWYECDSYREFYDEWHRNDIKHFCDWGERQKYAGLFSKEYPAGDVLKMCVYGGKPYMTEEFLNTGRAFSVSAADKKEISAMLQRYAAAVGEKPDTSLSTMRERTADGTLLPEKKAVNAAVVAKAGRGGR